MKYYDSVFELSLWQTIQDHSAQEKRKEIEKKSHWKSAGRVFCKKYPIRVHMSRKVSKHKQQQQQPLETTFQFP